MIFALRNKQLLMVALVAFFTLLAIIFVLLSVAHFNVHQALHIVPNIIYPHS
ncbi:hypothetical protein KSZ_00860 [Dictyobacter formicarum]|uniref:Uncharacterized protein n=1 Tax=Dictyobacter formicarum TaxID=2778368 RepID=A0ABQ3V8I4_9CHLR|nr:hypothetical protein KSZ_00860 [Dictyobacter formicarum]